MPRDDPETKQATKNILEDWRRDPQAAADRHHWSAAFTSWLMCHAGFSMAEFKRSLGHRFYIAHALESRLASHRADDAATTRPEPGDLVCADASRGPTTRSMADYRQRRPFMIRCHLVVSIGNGTVRVVGGNVDGQVEATDITLGSTGSDAGLPWSANRRSGWAWFAVLKLQPDRD